MSWRHSVRLRLIDGLRRVIDHLSEDTVEVLGGAEVHSEPARHLNNLFVVSVPDDAAKGEIYDSQMMAGLQYRVSELNRFSSIPNLQAPITHRQVATAFNHDLIAHQKFPSGSLENPVDLSRLNASASGVES